MPDGFRQGLTVLLFTDLVDSVGVQRRLGTETYAGLLRRHDNIFREVMKTAPNGRILQHTGEGFFAQFSLTSEAVNTALRFQYCLTDEEWEDERPSVRIGLHLGEILELEADGSEEVKHVGMAVNLASRVMGLAQGGQILMTRGVFDDARQFIREHPPVDDRSELPHLQWPAHGTYRFKGIEEAIEVFEVGADDIAPLTPPPDGEKAFREVDVEEEQTLGWRPGTGLEIPYRSGWTLEEKIGEGGFGEVWLAVQNDIKERRVFKFCFDAERLRSFRREVTLFRLLRDALGSREDIARLFEVHLDSAPFFLESEYCPTGSLLDWSEAEGGIEVISLENRIGIVARVARAAAAAHSVGIIHKDIKPSNILIFLGEDGTPLPRLVDFGIGILSDPSTLADYGITQAGLTEVELLENASSRTGTRLYSAPEYMVGKPATVQGDIYALGVLLYQSVIGDLGRPLGPGWERDVSDPLLCEDISLCVDVDPGRRLDSAQDLAQRLDALDDRRAAKRQQKEDLRRREEEKRRLAALRREASRRRKIATLTIVLCTVLVGLLLVSSYGYFQERRVRRLIEREQRSARFIRDQTVVKGQRMEADRAALNEALAGEIEKREGLQSLLGSFAFREGVRLIEMGDIAAATAHLALALHLNREHLEAAELAMAHCRDWGLIRFDPGLDDVPFDGAQNAKKSTGTVPLGSVPAWFPEFLEAVCGQRVNEQGKLEMISEQERTNAREQVLGLHSEDPFSIWARGIVERVPTEKTGLPAP